jgi:hypothetical protein
MKEVLIGAYWGPRQESRGDGAIRLSYFFEAIKASDLSLPAWEMVIDNDVTTDTSADNLVLAFTDSRTEDAPDRPLDLSMGHYFRGWTAKGVRDARINGCIGSTRHNNFLITTREGEFTDEQLKHLFQVTVQVFDPDAAMITGGEMLAGAYKRLNAARSEKKYPPLSHEPAWCNYKRGTPLSLESFSRG